MLAALRAHRVPAVSVVNENKLEAPTADERAARVALLTQWVSAGHVLGNHGYSHRDANAADRGGLPRRHRQGRGGHDAS